MLARRYSHRIKILEANLRGRSKQPNSVSASHMSGDAKSFSPLSRGILRDRNLGQCHHQETQEHMGKRL